MAINDTAPVPATLSFLQGGGELGALARDCNWQQTSLGAPESWPLSLRTTLGILLHSSFPMFLFWGPELICFYNNAYRPSLGNDGKHPCVGKPAKDVWPEVWDLIGSQIDHVLRTGESTFHKNQLISIYRNGKMDEGYWTYSYSPVIDEGGGISGVFVTCTETTEAVLDPALSESEARFRALVTATSDVIYRMSPDWNEMRQLDGKGFLSSTNEPILNWIDKYVPPAVQPTVRNEIQKAIAGKRHFKMEHQVLRADGTPGWTFSRAVPILNDTGDIIEWFGAATDITERKSIEQDLRIARDKVERSKRLYETITDNTPDLIYVFDLNYRFSYANKALLEMWGKTWDESIGQGLRALGYEEWHAAMHEREIDQIIATKQPVRGTVTFPHAVLGTRYYDYILTPVIGESGEVEAVAGTTRDVTDLKLAVAAMAESEARFRVLADSMPQMVWSTRADGYHDYFNAQWYEYTGVPYGSTDGDEWNGIFHPEDQQRAMNRWQHSLQTGEPYEVEYRLRRYDGEYRWTLGRALPQRNEGGAIIRWFGTCTEIHDQKLLHEKLEHLVQQRTVELQRSNEDLQQFAHVASHDLKEPLRKIVTFINLLDSSDGKQLSEAGRTSLSRVRKATTRMMDMVSGVLSYSKLSVTEQAWEPIDLAATIAGVEEDLEIMIAEKGALVEKEPLPPVTGAPVLIHQLFYNLLNNALKFSRKDVQPCVRISGQVLDDGKVQIVVADNGIGFEAEYAGRIFKTFIRLHSKDDYEGTGLGLSLCKKIVERHGGSIQAEGRPGEGAKFTLVLPGVA